MLLQKKPHLLRDVAFFIEGSTINAYGDARVNDHENDRSSGRDGDDSR